ncbi:hypothetical protein [Flavobacterium sp.]|uniref:hypothetical protein n=1 Tax=Flavobacterium sp. TaxID=239 RepID=UPI0026069CC8|nr:hypothetical protein [Flavobacterium sp.]
MKYQIKTDYKRLGLHDSHLSEIKIENDKIFINLDWGFLENYSEDKTIEAIIFDKAKLNLDNIYNQSFKKYDEIGFVDIEKPDNFELDEWLVMENKYQFNDNKHIFTLSITNYSLYLQWTIVCINAELNWDKFILHKNWLTGEQSLG